jgi:radical SAM protein with 4Fe4S-binding SPASM domain
MKRMFCAKPWENVLIEVNGDVYFCCFSKRPEGRIGNLKIQSFEEIWNSSEAQKIRREIMKGKIPLGCLNCDLFNFGGKSFLFLKRFYRKLPLLKTVIERFPILSSLKTNIVKKLKELLS